MALKVQDRRLRTESSRRLGELGEQLAAEHVVQNGYRLVLANFTVPIGRNTNQALVTGEIDLIAIDNDVLCFIEVKTRSSDEFTGPLSAVDLRKQRQITRTARVYRRIFDVWTVNYRYDVITVVMKDDIEPHIELVKNFWTESRFRKKEWSGDIY